jgi:hypothetical protein
MGKRCKTDRHHGSLWRPHTIGSSKGSAAAKKAGVSFMSSHTPVMQLMHVCLKQLLQIFVLNEQNSFELR